MSNRATHNASSVEYFEEKPIANKRGRYGSKP